MSLNSETKLLEFSQWFNYHKKTITALDKRGEFLEKAVENLAIIALHLVEDVRVLEGRGPIGRNMEVITPANNLLRTIPRKSQVPVKMDLKKIRNG